MYTVSDAKKDSMEQQLVILDVETTGLKPENGFEIVELAAHKVVRDRVLDTFHAIIKPMHPVDPGSMEVHGITENEIDEQGKTAAEVFPEFLEFITGQTLVGHNVQFDLGFINAHLTRLKLPVLSNPTMDTLDIARRLLILPSYSLEKVAQYLKVSQPSAHRAVADVQTTHGVLLKLFERAKV